MPSRRDFFAGGLCAALVAPARAAEDVVTLEAAALAGGGLGYNGTSPGPVLRAVVGRPMTLRLVNKLAEPTSLYWPGRKGGFPGLDAAALAPGESGEIAFTPAEPGFQLYAPYGPGAAAGLLGALVVDAPAPPEADLDAVVLLTGADASSLRVNGAGEPLRLTAPPGGRVRLRLANASPDWAMSFRANGARAQIIAIDGQPSELFAPRGGEFPLCPSARFELMFDLGEAAAEFSCDGRPALRIEPKGARVAARPPIAALPANPRLPGEIALERALRVSATITGDAAKGFAINGIGGAGWPVKPLFQIKRGAPVALTLINETATAQTLRLEGHVARQLHALDDGWDPYWRDALYIRPGHTLHAAFVADAAGRWPLASASPDYRAKGLKAWWKTA